MHLPNALYHVYNQGNNRQKIFLENRDYYFFFSLYKQLFSDCLYTLAWSLMPNHFHFMVQTDERSVVLRKQGSIFINSISNNIRKLLSRYAQYFNTRYNRTGSLFRQKTKSKLLTDNLQGLEPGSELRDHCINCFHYIHQNPVIARLVDKPEDWQFSSYRDHANLRQDSVCSRELAAKHCGYREDEFELISNLWLKQNFLETTI